MEDIQIVQEVITMNTIQILVWAFGGIMVLAPMIGSIMSTKLFLLSGYKKSASF